MRDPQHDRQPESQPESQPEFRRGPVRRDPALDALSDGAMPPDIASLDRFLARTLGPQAAVDEARLARIVAASVESLPVPEPLPFRRWQPLRRARVALAAAAVLALAAGSLVALRQGIPERSEGTPIVLDSDAGSAPITPADPTRPGAAEATLIALLTDATPGHSAWIDDRVFGGTDAGRAVAPLLQTRGAGIDDLFAELGSIFGTFDPQPM